MGLGFTIRQKPAMGKEGVGDFCCTRALPPPYPFLFPLPLSILSIDSVPHPLLGSGEPPPTVRGPAIVEPPLHFTFPPGCTWQHFPEATCQSVDAPRFETKPCDSGLQALSPSRAAPL